MRSGAARIVDTILLLRLLIFFWLIFDFVGFCNISDVGRFAFQEGDEKAS